MVRSHSRRRSDTCPWNLEQPEVFRYGFGIYAFDVREAKKIICANPREIRSLSTPPELIESLIGRPPDPNKLEFDMLTVGVNWKRAEEADLTIPLIVAQARVDPDSDERKTVLIDGHHRLAKAYLHGVIELPFVMLTEEETDEIMTTTIKLSKRRKK